MVAIRKSHKRKHKTLWDTREWSDYIAYVVKSYRSYSNFKGLNDHDWDDITQIARIHAWKKRRFYRKDQPLKPWLKVVTLNQIQNQLRNRFHHSKKGASLYKWYLRTPRSIITKTVAPNSVQEEVRYEPDMIDPRTTNHPVMREDLGALPRRLEFTLGLLTNADNVAEVAKNLNGGRRPKRGNSMQQRIYKHRKELRGYYRKAILNG